MTQQNLGTINVDENNQASPILLNEDSQININPQNIKFLEINDSVDKITFSIPK